MSGQHPHLTQQLWACPGPGVGLGTVDNGCPLKGEALGKVHVEGRDGASVTRGQSCTALLEEPQSFPPGQAPLAFRHGKGLSGSPGPEALASQTPGGAIRASSRPPTLGRPGPVAEQS